MKKILFYSLFILFIMSFINCAGTKGGADKKNPTKYKKRIERVTSQDFQNKAIRVLVNRNQYLIFRNEPSDGQLYIETDWRFRSPFDDELASGAVEARTKIILTAYPREMTNPNGLWVPTMEGLNEVKLEGGGIWVVLPMSDMAKKYFDRIADDLNLEFRTGIRNF